MFGAERGEGANFPGADTGARGRCPTDTAQKNQFVKEALGKVQDLCGLKV